MSDIILNAIIILRNCIDGIQFKQVYNMKEIKKIITGITIIEQMRKAKKNIN